MEKATLERVEACDACGSASCPDKHLCDVRPLAEGEEVPVRHVEPLLRAVLRDGADADSLWVEWRRFHDAEADPQPWVRANQALTAILRAGLTLREAQRYLGVSGERVARALAKGAVDPAALFAADELLRRGAETYADVAAATGLSADRVQALAEATGNLSAATIRMRSGGGFKYGPAIYERVFALRAEGLSYAAIAAAVRAEFPDEAADIGRNTVIGIVRRHMPKVAA